MSPTERLAAQVWAWIDGEHAAVLAWLARLGCTVRPCEVDQSWAVEGLTGVTVGLWVGMDPPGIAVSLGVTMFGPWWPLVVPGYLPLVNRQWHARSAARRQGGPGG
jgi:hypothetical protein